jgi:hypothetical protein
MTINLCHLTFVLSFVLCAVMISDEPVVKVPDELRAYVEKKYEKYADRTRSEWRNSSIEVPGELGGLCPRFAAWLQKAQVFERDLEIQDLSRWPDPVEGKVFFAVQTVKFLYWKNRNGDACIWILFQPPPVGAAPVPDTPRILVTLWKLSERMTIPSDYAAVSGVDVLSPYYENARMPLMTDSDNPFSVFRLFEESNLADGDGYVPFPFDDSLIVATMGGYDSISINRTSGKVSLLAVDGADAWQRRMGAKMETTDRFHLCTSPEFKSADDVVEWIGKRQLNWLDSEPSEPDGSGNRKQADPPKQSD